MDHERLKTAQTKEFLCLKEMKLLHNEILYARLRVQTQNWVISRAMKLLSDLSNVKMTIFVEALARVATKVRFFDYITLYSSAFERHYFSVI